jgi:hypothetical protein
MTDANARNRILTGVHSPGQFRYIDSYRDIESKRNDSDTIVESFILNLILTRMRDSSIGVPFHVEILIITHPSKVQNHFKVCESMFFPLLD